MKSYLMFLFTTLVLGSAHAKINNEFILIDSTKPLYILIETQSMGPRIQCYFGSLANGSFLTGALMSYEPLDEQNNYYFSQTQGYQPSTVASMLEKPFSSDLSCHVLDDLTERGASRVITASIQIYQDANEILFSESYTEMTRNGDSTFWRTPLKSEKTLEFVAP